MNTESIRITILADNRAESPFVSEHGFCAHVDCGLSGAFLLDTGRGVLFANAVSAGVDLKSVEAVAISHGHYDHTDGLAEFLGRYPATIVYASCDVTREHYSIKTGSIRDISLNADVRATIGRTGFTCIADGKNMESLPVARTSFLLVSPVPRVHAIEEPNPFLFANKEGTIPDIVPDEAVCFTDTPKGLVILTGCCHAGLINTCEYVRSLVPGRPIKAVIGGFHLSGVSPERIEATAEYIRAQGIGMVVACHCTGDHETNILSGLLGNILVRGQVGLLMTF